MKFSPDILIYIQTVKNFLENNEGIRKYFLTNVDEDLFFENLGQIAEINLTKNGEPQLSKEQFEVLRLSLQIFKKVDFICSILLYVTIIGEVIKSVKYSPTIVTSSTKYSEFK